MHLEYQTVFKKIASATLKKYIACIHNV